jgi:hypothetical protein
MKSRKLNKCDINYNLLRLLVKINHTLEGTIFIYNTFHVFRFMLYESRFDWAERRNGKPLSLLVP